MELTEQQQKIMQFAKQMENLVSNNFITAQKKNIFAKKFNSDNVATYLSNAQKYEKELRDLSMVLTTISTQYNQIVNYIGDICLFKAVITPNVDKYTDAKGNVKDLEKIKKDYLKATNYLQIMNIEHEFKKITKICTRQDIFYGYIHKTNNSFFIQEIDPDYARVKYVLDGCMFYEFDMSFFDKNNTLKGLDNSLLIDTYPQEFKSAYNSYLKDKNNNRWFEPDEANCICVKFNESLPFNIPPYSNLYSELATLEDYKQLMKAKTEIENYKLIGLKIPVNTKSDKPDDFLVSTETSLAFFQMLQSSLAEGIGTFLVPHDFEAVSFSNANASDRDSVSKAEDSVYTSSGISSVVFGKNANSSTGLKTSNLIDSAKCYTLYRQFERWLNHHFKNEFNEKFNIKLLDVTVHTLQEEVDRYYKLATMSVPVKLQLSSLVTTQAEERGSLLMEEVLDLMNTWKPLSSSYVQTGAEESGRPEKEDKDLTESGESTKDRGDNIDK